MPSVKSADRERNRTAVKLAIIDDDGSEMFLPDQLELIILQLVDTGLFGGSQALAVERILARWALDNAVLLEKLGVTIPRTTVRLKRKK